MKRYKDTNYFVTENGEVYSTSYNFRWNTDGKFRKMKPQEHRQGYLLVKLYKNGKGRKFKIHRLVSEIYIPNPNNLPQVNHIDGDKSNNHVSNLEWCTPSHNIKHAYNTGLKKPRK
jgi:hypothetical protein